MMEKQDIDKGTIYKATNKINDKSYIGQTINLSVRKKRHYVDSTKIDNFFYRAIRKYGWDSFVWSVLEKVDIEKLNEKESYYIDKFDTYKNGYNMTTGGYGKIFSVEAKENMSKAQTKRWASEGARKEQSEKSKDTWSKSEFKEKMCEMRKGKGNAFYNKHHTEKTIQKIKEKCREASLGENNARHGVKLSKQLKEKIRKGMKKYWAKKNAKK